MAGNNGQDTSIRSSDVPDSSVLDWICSPETVVQSDEKKGAATLNACSNCLDRHVRDGHGERAALVYDAPVIDFCKTISFGDLLDEVATFAAVLADHGVRSGDRVVLFLPMIPRLAVAMLACARLGAVYVVVPSTITVRALTACLDETTPKLILTASCIVEPDGLVAMKPTVDEAVAAAKAQPEGILVWQRPRLVATMADGRDHDWEALIEAADAAGRRSDCFPVAARDPLCILFHSDGQGGWRSARYEVAATLVALSRAITADYGINPGEVVFAAFDEATLAGHALGVLAPLLIGAGTVCYEGGAIDTPDAGALWRVCADHAVVTLCADPATLDLVREADPDARHFGRYPCPKLRTIVAAGWPDPQADSVPPASLDDLRAWAARLGRPLVDLRRDPTNNGSGGRLSA